MIPTGALPDKVLQVAAHVSEGAKGEAFTLGELVALYGDYRRTTWCKSPGSCYLTSGDIATVHFKKGTWAYMDYCPKVPRPAADYLRAIGSGLVPPHGSLGNTSGNTAGDDEWNEAGWWGDEMLRGANVNDSHFSSAAIAWYVGLHRMALVHVAQSVKDPEHWIQALHYEANALHALTDLFAFGHVVTNRDETSWGVMNDKKLLSQPAYLWMEHVLKMGGATRDGKGVVSLSAALPRITDSTGPRRDLLKSYLWPGNPNWIVRAKGEKDFHDHFNQGPTRVQNFAGQVFDINGDGGLRNLPPSGRAAIMSAVGVSVQSLFDARVALGGGGNVDEIGSAGSPYFGALKQVPVYVVDDPDKYFLGQWARYAEAVARLTGSTKVRDWNLCRIPALDGNSDWPQRQRQPCSPF